ncbi:hypothetical protein FK530_22545 [Tsukamurella conjunctivitidis]|uniref:Uncharacterized protein n=1 Tax=Tsukamurella conjunctivitidis TaxID=2592068 RepID=A0A5C5RRC7_9ACTN|nr:MULTISPECIES: hypothetical protein [Tsukamurella]TWS25619.1 hypothetical protein FK530_22545 [Tsukamurella conjunctivitidis]
MQQRNSQTFEGHIPNRELRDLVNRAIDEGRADDLDVVVRARYAYQWGGGNALHLELAQEVERLRTMLAAHDLLTDGTKETSG